MKRFAILIAAASLTTLGNSSCGSSTDRIQAQQTEKLVAQAERVIGMPGIRNFTERRHAKMVLELRDSEITTYTYTVDLNGKLRLLCESIGYGLPYSVQYTNPMRRSPTGGYTLPQPDPNGLFMPSGLDATFVLCAGTDNKIHPVYSEPKIIVSPFPLKYIESYK